MQFFHDPDEPNADDAQEHSEGALPAVSRPHGRAWLLRFLRRNWPMLATIVGLFGFLGILAMFLAIRAMHMPVSVVQQPDALKITTSGASTPAAGTAEAGTVIPGAVQLDANGQVLSPVPPGVDPVEYRRYLAWRQACPNGQCQQQTQNAGQSTADRRRQKMEELLWEARFAKPDSGNKHASGAPGTPPAAATTAQAAPPVPAVANPSPTAPASPDAPQPQEKALLYAPWDGPIDQSYLLLGGLSPIKARLITSITADDSGPLIAEVVQPTFTWDATTVLIPKGSFLTGSYQRVQEHNQERVFLSVDTLTMPDAFRVKFPEAPVLDQSGNAGLKDRVNHHYAATFLTSIAVAGIGAGASFGGGSSQYGYSPVSALQIGLGQGSSQAAQQLLAPGVNRKPTLLIRPGVEIVLFPPTDVPLPAWKDHHVRKPI